MNISDKFRRIVGAGLTAFLTASALAAALGSPAQGGALDTDQICASRLLKKSSLSGLELGFIAEMK